MCFGKTLHFATCWSAQSVTRVLPNKLQPWRLQLLQTKVAYLFSWYKSAWIRFSNLVSTRYDSVTCLTWTQLYNCLFADIYGPQNPQAHQPLGVQHNSCYCEPGRLPDEPGVMAHRRHPLYTVVTLWPSHCLMLLVPNGQTKEGNAKETRSLPEPHSCRNLKGPMPNPGKTFHLNSWKWGSAFRQSI